MNSIKSSYHLHQKISTCDNHLGLDFTLPLPIFLAVDFPLLHVSLLFDRGLRHFPYDLGLSGL